MKRFFLKQTLLNKFHTSRYEIFFFTPNPLSPFWESIYRYPYSQFVIRFLGSLTRRSLLAMLVSCPCFTLTNWNLFGQQQMLRLFSMFGTSSTILFQHFLQKFIFLSIFDHDFLEKMEKKRKIFFLDFC